MIKLIFKPTGSTSLVRHDENLLERVQAIAPNIPATCGGKGNCGTCMIHILEGHGLLTQENEIEKHHKNLLSAPPTARLACQAKTICNHGEILFTSAHTLQPLRKEKQSNRTFQRFYLDHISSTVPDPQVIEAMMPYFSLANSASPHFLGKKVQTTIDAAKQSIADTLQVPSENLFFTHDKSTAHQMLLQSITPENNASPLRLLTTPDEDFAFSRVFFKNMEPQYETDFVTLGPNGLIALDQLANQINNRHTIASFHLAHPLTGTMQDVHGIHKALSSNNTILHLDVSSAIGRMHLDFSSIRAQAFSIQSDLIYGPPGIALLYLSSELQMREPRLQSLCKENSFSNLPALIGFAKALELITSNIEDEIIRLQDMRDDFEQHLKMRIGGIQIIGKKTKRLPHISLVHFSDFDPQNLHASLDWEGIMTYGVEKKENGKYLPHPYLAAMQLSNDTCCHSINFSFGRTSRKNNQEAIIEKVLRACEMHSALYPDPKKKSLSKKERMPHLYK